MSEYPVNVGVVGCGRISDQYLKQMGSHDILDVVACADLDLDRAKAQAAKYDIPTACTVDELLDDDGIEIVVNLTVPDAHAAVSLSIVEAGKSVYSEKPLTTDLEGAETVLDAADANGVLVGCAPDTFLSDPAQTCRRLIDEGAIGEPVAATGYFMNHGNEHRHPDPTHRYQAGTGPMYDMGPYFLTALISLIGPVRRVSGSARVTFPTRTITSDQNYGKVIDVKTPTHVAGVLDFAGGSVGTITTSFDVWDNLNRTVIYGSEGSITVPDPTRFDGTVQLRPPQPGAEWMDVPVERGPIVNGRGMGVAELAHALRFGDAHRANGEMARHIVEIMLGIHTASLESRAVEIVSTCGRPARLGQ